MTDNSIRIICGDCLVVMPTLGEGSVDSIVTDPPYGLGFMGKDWDHGVPGVHFWIEALRVAKPGAHLLAFGGTRTFHRLAVAIENAGWEIRDCLMWVYGGGFPKSHNLDGDWKGWGTALKPAWEPIIVARKPLIGTVAANVAAHGTGAINVDGCRIGDNAGWSYPNGRGGSGWHGRDSLSNNLTKPMESTLGRWPANLIHDGSEEVLELFPNAPGQQRATGPQFTRNANVYGTYAGVSEHQPRNDSGSAARFFYCAKASKTDREEGCGDLEAKVGGIKNASGRGFSETDPMKQILRQNNHPTVKPTALMRYLCRLVTPAGGVVLDPFMGSGSTGKAASAEGMKFVGIEMNSDYCEISKKRIGQVLTLPI